MGTDDVVERMEIYVERAVLQDTTGESYIYYGLLNVDSREKKTFLQIKDQYSPYTMT